MRGERIEGRFSVDSERKSIISGTSKELVRTVGSNVEWWFFDDENTVVDAIYDVGSDSSVGGRRWIGPMPIPVVNANLDQGVTAQNDRGFYNTDVLTITINMDVIDSGRNRTKIGITGSNMATIPQLSKIQTNPDHYLTDRIVFRSQVFTPIQIFPEGIITDQYTLITVRCAQVNAEELVNDPQFQEYANYSPLQPITPSLQAIQSVQAVQAVQATQEVQGVQGVQGIQGVDPVRDAIQGLIDPWGIY
jgi:hypothetical protein